MVGLKETDCFCFFTFTIPVCLLHTTQGVDLGAWLRARYMDKYNHLPQQYDPRLMSLRTTCIQRTVLTLQGVLSGIYPDLKVVVPLPGLYIHMLQHAYWIHVLIFTVEELNNSSDDGLYFILLLGSGLSKRQPGAI